MVSNKARALFGFVLYYVATLALGSILAYSANAIGSRLKGPVIFNLNAFIFEALALTLLAVIAFKSFSRVLAFSMLYTALIYKVIAPYFVFNGHVNYDSPVHYLSALYLRDHGITYGYHYHSWPHAPILVDMFNSVTAFIYPADASIIAVASRALIPLFVYLGSKQISQNTELSFLALAILLVFEPFILHYSPQIVAVTLLVMFIYILVFKKLESNASFLLALLASISLFLSHAMMPLFATLFVISLIVVQLWILKGDVPFYKNSKAMYRTVVLAVILLLIALAYNISITVFVTRSIIRTIQLILTSGEARLDVYSVIIDIPELAWQYETIKWLSRIAIVILLGIPSATEAFRIAVKALRRNLASDEFSELLVILACVLGIATFVVGNIILSLGLFERYYQIAIILAPIVAIKCMDHTKSKHKVVFNLKKVFIVFVAIFIFISIFVTSSYTTIFADSFSEREVYLSSWVSKYTTNNVLYLDGAGRLNQLILLMIYPRFVYPFNVSLGDNIARMTYTVPEGSLITIRPFAILATRVSGVRLSELSEFISSLSFHVDISLVYSDGICLVYTS